ncbi:malto-oligosyltrehalose trehalohydrolase, partial [Pseudomonas aeruginosa]
MTGFAHDLPFGATLLAPDRTRFRLWAPDRDAVSVEIAGSDTVAMAATGDGWFEAEAACGAGTGY